MQIGQNPKEEFEKVGFPVFAILQKNFQPEVGVANRKVIQLHSGNLGIQGFWMCNIRFGSYRPKWIYVVFLCLDQPSKLHRPPLHGLACSITFSRRKIKIIKAASSVERALAVHVRRGMLLSMHAAVGACCHRGMLKQHLPLRKSLLYYLVDCYCRYETMYDEVRKTVWPVAWIPRQRLSRWSASGAGWR